MTPAPATAHSAEFAALEALADVLRQGPANQLAWRDAWAVVKKLRHAPGRASLLDFLAWTMRLERINRARAEHETIVQVLLKLRKLGTAPAVASWAMEDRADREEEALRRLFITHLEFGRTLTLEMEGYVTALRRELLGHIGRSSGAADVDLCAALAIHCFFHEYVFEESPEEHLAVEAIVARLAAGKTDAREVAIVAAYRPLRGLEFGPKLAGGLIEHPSPGLQKMLKVDVLDWMEEKAIAGRIERLTPIDDDMSQVVKAQYEANPYPRWRYLSFDQTAGAAAGETKRILVAGCGTGQHALAVAAQFPAAEIWAMDLSAASLAYAMRSAAAYGFRGLRFFQGDILALSHVTAQFDEIMCGGVLHHLREPERGLVALCERLKPGGSITLALYSNSGRRCIPHVIALRERLKLEPSLEGIRRLRIALAALGESDPAYEAVNTSDFYTTSNNRDAFFHVQEHRYDLPELAAMYARHGLVAYLDVPAAAKAIFLARFPEGDPHRDFARWGEVEAEHDNLFGSMYTMYVRKA
jgi:SAM-dependent methyltransferase